MLLRAFAAMRRLLNFVLGLLLLLAVAAGGLLWRLDRGPISLAPLQPLLQAWRERVVAEPSRPDQVPDRGLERPVVDRLAHDRAGRVGELAEEVRTAAGQRQLDRLVQRRGLEVGDELLGVGQGQVRGVGEVQRHPAIGAGQAAVTRPEHLAGRGQLVEHRGVVVDDPAAEHERLDLTSFIMRSALPAAREVMVKADRIVLSERDTRRVLDLLENPPPPTEALVIAARRWLKRQ